MTRLAAVALGLGLIAGVAQAADGPKTRAVQNRLHTMRHEYTAWVGALPMDAFTKGLTFSGAYTLHLTDWLAWEVGQFTYSIGIDTQLQDKLNALPQPVGPTPFEVVDFYGTSNIVFKPAYGKLAVLNRAVLYHELFFVAGAGAGRMTLTTRPVVDFGFGARIYAGKHFSLRLDVRDVLFIGEETENELWIGLGFSVSHGG